MKMLLALLFLGQIATFIYDYNNPTKVIVVAVNDNGCSKYQPSSFEFKDISDNYNYDNL